MPDKDKKSRSERIRDLKAQHYDFLVLKERAEQGIANINQELERLTTQTDQKG